MFEKYALISLSDKSNLEILLAGLKRNNYKILATHSTALKIIELGYDTQFIENITAYPEMFDGRVKTLQPEIHGGILADLNNERHLKDLENYNINPISLVVCNLYPFKDVLENESQRHENIINNNVNQFEIMESLATMNNNIIENIDIGGVTLIRAAAKNYKHVGILCNPDDYQQFVDNLDNDKFSLEYRKILAQKGFIHTANYDIMIANYFMSSNDNQSQLLISAPLKQELRYGENPHQNASCYVNKEKSSYSINSSTVIQGKELSYNNFLDIDSAYQSIVEFEKPCAIALKHNTPCGIGIGKNILEAYQRCYQVDSLSIFGGIVIFNRQIDEELALLLNKTFLEIIIAPNYTKEALSVFKIKKNVRIIKGDFDKKMANNKQIRSINGGYLVQNDTKPPLEMNIVTKGNINDEILQRLTNLYKAVKNVKSNAVIIGQEDFILGISGGMVSRVDACEFALKKAINNSNYDKKSPLYLASDGFFPFNDIVDLAIKYKIKYIINPGGSKNDQSLINACNDNDIQMIFTGIRYFRH